LLDFIRDRINREMKYEPINEGRVYEYERTYYILRKYLDAKHAVELKKVVAEAGAKSSIDPTNLIRGVFCSVHTSS